METQHTRFGIQGGWGIRKSHVGFALALALGVGLLPADGVTTISGWIAGTVTALVLSFLLMVVVIGVIRYTDDWRPAQMATPEIPDSPTKHLVFVAIVLQLFLYGLATALGLNSDGLFYLVAPFNVLAGVAIAVDVLALRRHGVDWQWYEFAYLLAAFLFGFLASLLYWRHRGRKRLAATDTTESE